MTPTERSLRLLRDRGWTAGVVERRLPRGFTTVDLFGFADIVACIPHATFPTPGIVEHGGIKAIQTTSGSHTADRVKKILAEPRAKAWLESGGRIEVWGWRKLKPRGVKRPRWQCDERCVTLADFTTPPVRAA